MIRTIDAHAAGEPLRLIVEGVSSPRGRTIVERVTFVNVPSFVLHGGLSVLIGHRKVRADVAFGGAFYAIVDSEAVGLSVDVAHLPELRRAGMAIARAIEDVQTIAHPIEAGIRGLAGTIFTASPGDDRSALRNVTIFSGGEAEPSPGGTGTVGEYPAIVPEIEGAAWITGEHTFLIDEDDPLKEGCRI